ncbi:hypothetical protein [Amaricoccus sp.]|uniref:hypothetical protein n=1 Tax=Amaricoccus sp. TaxID=1872485 RepID=UPI002615C746|nr:hypothetical protein [uncultured Amaricoccus sp.]
MRAAVAGIIVALSALRAEAGAWPREEGTTFISLSQVFTTGTESLLAPTETLTSYSSLYAEYGLTGTTTIGFDAAYGTGPEARLGTGIAFVRRPIWETPSGHRFAADFGVGWRTESGDQDVRLRPGLAWGRGFESAWGNGWMGVDASAELLLPSDDTAFKVDFTTGVKPSDDWMLIFQVQTGRYAGTGALVRVAPSVVRAFGEKSHLQIGLDATVFGDDSIGVKLATWFSF